MAFFYYYFKFLWLKNARDKKNIKTFFTSLAGSVIYNFRQGKKKVKYHRMKTAICESCNTHTLYHLLKAIITKIVYEIYYR